MIVDDVVDDGDAVPETDTDVETLAVPDVDTVNVPVPVMDRVGDGDEHIVLPAAAYCPEPHVPVQLAVVSPAVAPY